VRFEEASIDELQVRFKRAGRLSFALWFQGKYKDGRKEQTNDKQSDRKLMEWVTGDKS
jgi:hypothetical protein